MTTISFNDAGSFNHADFTGAARFRADRAPRQSFAARLAVLQARTEQAPHLTGLFGVAARAALAAVPFVGLTWVFVTI